MMGIGAMATSPRGHPSNDLRGKAIDGEWTRFSPQSGTIGVPRDAMPQIAAENRGAMVRFLGARGVAHEKETIPANTLRPTQAEFSEAKVKKAKRYTGGERAILVSNDNHILDGHHQWIAAYDKGGDVDVIRLGASIGNLINTLRDMPSAATASGTPSPMVVVAPSPTGGIGALVNAGKSRGAPFTEGKA